MSRSRTDVKKWPVSMHHFHSIYIREMLALLLSRAEGQMWCSPHLSPCGTSRLRFRTCKHSGNMNVKLCRSKRGEGMGRPKEPSMLPSLLASVLIPLATQDALSRGFSFSWPFHLESLSLWFVVTVTILNDKCRNEWLGSHQYPSDVLKCLNLVVLKYTYFRTLPYWFCSKA